MYRRQGGFSLLELALVMVVLSLLIGSGVVAFKRYQGQTRIAADRASVVASEKTLLAYLQRMHRLPCPDQPDSNGVYDGIENICNGSFGQLPYRTLGLDAVPLDGSNRPLRYVVNESLAASPAPQKAYAFCKGLWDLSSTVDATMLANVNGNANLGYAVVTGEPNAAGVLQTTTVTLSDGTTVDAYRVDPTAANGVQLRTRGLYALQGLFNCPAVLASVNAMASERVNTERTYTLLGITRDFLDDKIAVAEAHRTLAYFAILDATAAGLTMAAKVQLAFAQAAAGNAPGLVASLALGIPGAAMIAHAARAPAQINTANTNITEYTAYQGRIDNWRERLQQQCSSIENELNAQSGGSTLCP